MHYTTKSLFVGAAIACTGMSSGKADITFDEGFRENVKNIVRDVMADRYKALNALYPNMVSDIQLQEDVDRIYNSLFDRNTGFAHYFTDAFYNEHHTGTDIWRLYAHPGKTLKYWLGRNVLREGFMDLPDDVVFQGNTTLHIRTAVDSLIRRLKQEDRNTIAAARSGQDKLKVLQTVRSVQDKLNALQGAGFITRCYCDRMVIYDPTMAIENEKLSCKIAELWYPYVLERFDEGRRVPCEVEPMLADYRSSSRLSRAFLISLLNNYSRYLTIKRALQNNEFSSDIYEMYIRFKEFNKALERMGLLEKYSTKTGNSGAGILSYIGFDYSDFYRIDYCNEEKHWGRMMKKREEMGQLCDLVDGHPEAKRLSRRSRKLMHIWADTDNR